MLCSKADLSEQQKPRKAMQSQTLGLDAQDSCQPRAKGKESNQDGLGEDAVFLHADVLRRSPPSFTLNAALMIIILILKDSLENK